MQNWYWFLLVGALTYLITLGAAFWRYVSKNDRWGRRRASQPRAGSSYKQCDLFSREALLDLLAPEILVLMVHLLISLFLCMAWNRLALQGFEQAQSGWLALALTSGAFVSGAYFGQKLMLNWGHAKAMKARGHSVSCEPSGPISS